MKLAPGSPRNRPSRAAAFIPNRIRPARAARHLPARPRPHHPLGRLPPPALQDPGVHRPRRRPFPGAPDPQPRSRADRPHDGARARPQRRPDRGSVPRARPRPPAVRPRRRGCADRGARRQRRVRPQCPHAAHRDPAGEALSRFRRAQLELEALEGLAKHNGPIAEPSWALAEANAERTSSLPLAGPRGAGRSDRRRHRLRQPRHRRRAALRACSCSTS